LIVFSVIITAFKSTPKLYILTASKLILFLLQQQQQHVDDKKIYIKQKKKEAIEKALIKLNGEQPNKNTKAKMVLDDKLKDFIERLNQINRRNGQEVVLDKETIDKVLRENNENL
jgi:guanylate kinase